MTIYKHTHIYIYIYYICLSVPYIIFICYILHFALAPRRLIVDSSFRRHKEEESLRLRLLEENRLRVIAIAAERRNAAASNIQRVFRGYTARQKNSAFLTKRKAFLALRVQEMPKRVTRLYGFRDFFGMAPILMSDTPKERVLKMYPRPLRPTVIDCMKGQWWIATEHLARIEKRRGASIKGGQKMSASAAFASLMGMLSAKRRMDKAKSNMARREKTHEARRKQYRDVSIPSVAVVVVVVVVVEIVKIIREKAAVSWCDHDLLTVCFALCMYVYMICVVLVSF